MYSTVNTTDSQFFFESYFPSSAIIIEAKHNINNMSKIYTKSYD